MRNCEKVFALSCQKTVDIDKHQFFNKDFKDWFLSFWNHITHKHSINIL